MDKHAVIIVGAAPPEQILIRGGIEDLIDVKGVEQNSARLAECIKKNTPEIAILYLDDKPDEILAASKEASLNPNVMVIVVSKSNDPQNILRAMRSGARDFAFLSPHDASDLRRAIEDLGLLRSRIQSSGRGKIISVFSAKGGSGATTIASNLAGVMLDHELDNGDKRRVALLDFDLEMGDVLAFLDVEIRYTYHDILSNMHRLDEEILHQSLTIHSSGLSVLTQSDKLDQAEDLNTEEMKQILEFLQQHFDFIIIDGLRDFRELSLLALDNAANVVLTATPDVPALKNANRCIQLFAGLGYTKDKVKLVINRFQKSRELNLDSISDALGRPIDGVVGNHFPSVIKSINEGALLIQSQPRSKVAKDIRDLGYLFVERAAPKQRSFLSFGRK